MRTAEELRRLDVMVAATVYKWGRHEDPEGDYLPDQGWFSEDPEFPRCGVVPHFTTDPKDCQGLKDKARADGWTFMVTAYSSCADKDSDCIFLATLMRADRDVMVNANCGDSELVAVVLACLRAYEVEV